MSKLPLKQTFSKWSGSPLEASINMEFAFKYYTTASVRSWPNLDYQEMYALQLAKLHSMLHTANKFTYLCMYTEENLFQIQFIRIAVFQLIPHLGDPFLGI